MHEGDEKKTEISKMMSFSWPNSIPTTGIIQMFPSKPQPPPSTPYYNLEIINLMEGLQSYPAPGFPQMTARLTLLSKIKTPHKCGFFASIKCPFHVNCN